MRALLADLRFACRRLGKAPGFTAATITMLALGIALSVAMFSVISNVVLAGLPFPGGDRVVAVNGEHVERQASGGLTPAEALRLTEADAPFEHFGYYGWGGMTVFDDAARPRELTVVNVGPGFFAALGMQPLHGRPFTSADFDAEAAVTVLSYDEWQRQFGADPAAIGQRIDTSYGALEVIGVMPPAFAMPSSDVGAWRPYPASAFKPDQPWHWNARFLNGVALLPQGGDVGTALESISAGLREQFRLDGGWRLRTTPLLELIIGNSRGVLWGAFAMALLVLLIGCANVAILVDARQVAQHHEQALVQALGASRMRVFRVLLMEIGLLGLVAAVLGVLLAWGGVDLLRELAQGSVPRASAIAIAPSVLGFALLLGLLLPFLAAAAGSLRLRGEASEAMRGGGKGMLGRAGRQSRTLPALGVALSTISLIAASALLLSLVRLQQVDPGFHSDNVHALQMFRDASPVQAWQFGEQLQERLQALPGVEQVAITSVAPLSIIGGYTIDIKLPDNAQPEPYQIGVRRVSAGYLDLLGIPLLAGRGIEAGDRAGSEAVAVINRELARRLFGDSPALDRIVELPLGNGPRVAYRVVGVVEDIRNDGLRAAPAPELLLSYARDPWVGMTFLVRSSKPLPGLELQIADALWQLDPREGITRQFTLAGELDNQLRAARFFARTIGAFAIAALLLAALGVYAVATLQQQRRIGEFGLRLAIGAKPLTLAAQILRDSAKTVAVGIVLGLFGAWAALQLLRTQLYGLEHGHASVIVLGVGALLLTALVATLLPAWRAARVDPMRALRWE